MCKHYVHTKPNNQETKVDFCFLFFYVHVKAINEHQNLTSIFRFSTTWSLLLLLKCRVCVLLFSVS